METSRRPPDASPPPRVVLAMVKGDPHDHVLFRSRLDEMRAIAEGAGYEVWSEVVQTRVKPDPKYLLGRGRVEALAGEIGAGRISAVVFWNHLTSRQKYDLESALEVMVLDRSELVLDLFRQNARTPEAKLQIELARLKKQFPYERFRALAELRTEQPGPKSLGDYAYMGRVRQLQEVIRKTTERLERIGAQKRMHRAHRRERGPLVALTGFYNAGKSTLFNALSRGSQEVAPRPFTTLATKVARVYTGNGTTFLADSIGFIQEMEDLEEIVASFDLTLDDIRTADLVLLLADLSEDAGLLRRKLVEARKTLRRLEVGPERTLLVYTKLDAVEGDPRGRAREADPGDLEALCVSARTGRGLPELRGAIARRLEAGP